MNARRYLPFLRRGLVQSGPPLHPTLFVTVACNARCRHGLRPALARGVLAGSPAR